MSDEILFTIDDDIGVVTLNRPQQRNALTLRMYERLAEICREQTIGGAAKALIIQGAGDKAFAAGTDMTEFRGFSQPQDALDYEAKMDQVLGDVERCAIPTIAAITGACTGGGGAIAAACDLRICDQNLKFGFPIARTLGNTLSITNLARIAALIGAGRLREILFTSRLIGADEALAIGFVSEVATDAEAVRVRAYALAELLSGQAPLTLLATKEGLRRLRMYGPEADGDDLITDAYMSADFKEGMEAFLAKRKPRWRGV